MKLFKKIVNQIIKENSIDEYYVQVSNPKTDSYILGNLFIYIYNNDRPDMTPHCHIMTKDKSIEIEVSLLPNDNYKILNVKRPKNTPNDWSYFSDIKDKFFKWLNEKNGKNKELTNNEALDITWNMNNQNNKV